MHCLGDREAVLEQPVPVGLVVVLGRRHVPELGPRRRVLAEQHRQQPAQVRILDRREQLAQIRLHLPRIAVGVVDRPLPLISVRKLVGFHLATKIKWLPDASDETELLTGTAIVTGGTGGLGAAVVARLLDDGWRVVVPWVVEEELSRVPERDGLELVQADLFDPDEVATVVAHGVADRGPRCAGWSTWSVDSPPAPASTRRRSRSSRSSSG